MWNLWNKPTHIVRAKIRVPAGYVFDNGKLLTWLLPIPGMHLQNLCSCWTLQNCFKVYPQTCTLFYWILAPSISSDLISSFGLISAQSHCILRLMMHFIHSFIHSLRFEVLFLCFLYITFPIRMRYILCNPWISVPYFWFHLHENAM
jgi:hypothetical protein